MPHMHGLLLQSMLDTVVLQWCLARLQAPTGSGTLESAWRLAIDGADARMQAFFCCPNVHFTNFCLRQMRLMAHVWLSFI